MNYAMAYVPCTARLPPPQPWQMAVSGPPAASDYEMQVAHILDHRHEAFVIRRIDIEGARPFRPPVAAAFEIAYFAARMFE